MHRLLILIVISGALIASFVGYLIESERQSRIQAFEQNEEEAYAVGAVVIAETAVATLDGVRVPIHGYQAEDPSFSNGPSMQFNLPTGSVGLTIGSTFEVGSKQYEVLNIWEDEDGHGYVSFIEISSELPFF